jgi:hypothetical protein
MMDTACLGCPYDVFIMSTLALLAESFFDLFVLILFFSILFGFFSGKPFAPYFERIRVISWTAFFDLILF